MAPLSAIRERESRLRSILKAITYRITGTIATALIVYIVTGAFELALAVGLVEPIAKIIIYYLHERAWQLVPKGTIRSLFLRRRRQKMSAGSDQRVDKGRPQPPPPGVSMTKVSPGPSVTVAVPGSSSVSPSARSMKLRPVAPGAPPSTPNGATRR